MSCMEACAFTVSPLTYSGPSFTLLPVSGTFVNRSQAILLRGGEGLRRGHMTGDKNMAADHFLIVCVEQEGDSQDGYLIG